MNVAEPPERAGRAPGAATSPELAARNASARRNRWAMAIVVAVLVHVTGFIMLRVPEVEPAPRHLAEPRVDWVGDAPATEGSALGEQWNLLDNAPLFLPTRWNFASAENLVTAEHEPGEIFGTFEAKLSVAAEQSPSALVTLPRGIDSATAALPLFDWGELGSFGRVDRPLAGLPERLAQVEIHSMTTGDEVLSVAVPKSAAAGAGSWPDWEPMELLVVIEPTGMIGPPQVARSSRSEIVDGFFRDYVRSGLRLDLRLPAGYFRVVIGP